MSDSPRTTTGGASGTARPVIIGISTKAYLGYRASLDWLQAVTDVARRHPAVVDGRVRLFVAPSAPLLESAVRLASGTAVVVAAQDVSPDPAGPTTGDTPASLLADMGVRLVEIGHAERRAERGETSAVIRAKIAQASAAGLATLLCIGESARSTVDEAVAACLAQVADAGSGRVVFAYEPIWAIGAPAPADPSYVREVVAGIRSGLPEALAGAPIIYGGSAGPGLLGELRPAVDGLFLGRFAHDPANVATVLDEAAAL
ncbi:triose-phosphate isomerase family protein [Frondihabitans australicus]|uniref:Triosephosphate isomerase n=1 Tax=Frondihabitans australicus TaxID=386892 RepID=A0A495IKT0_9MICO|nr:triose-phosphate isomerase family protein [Frondihabitans australicus]RKR76543.1 triosephosphate isomerase [Frondihabitans australicus]